MQQIYYNIILWSQEVKIGRNCGLERLDALLLGNKTTKLFLVPHSLGSYQNLPKRGRTGRYGRRKMKIQS